MNLNNEIYKDGLVKIAINSGVGSIKPIMFNDYLNKGVALMNPSVFNDNGQLRACVRCVNYALHHSEKNLIPYWAGPLQYVHPETDVRLATENYVVDFDDDLEVTKVRYVEMLLNKPPKWEFHGLEDARLVRWNDKLFLTGVRRDTTDDGQGRMELSEIELNDQTATEVDRIRIPASREDKEYCEKNWMPILDTPFTYIKWTIPTQIAAVHLFDNHTANITVMDRLTSVEVPNREIRGGSHVVRYGDYYVAFGHSVALWKPFAGEKDSEYWNHMILWDKDFNLIKVTEGFKFLNTKIEFNCGLALDNEKENFIVSFAAMDQNPYLFKVNADWLINQIKNM